MAESFLRPAIGFLEFEFPTGMIGLCLKFELLVCGTASLGLYLN